MNYPVLLESTEIPGLVVCMIANEQGFVAARTKPVLFEKNLFTVGYYSENWKEADSNSWKPYVPAKQESFKEWLSRKSIKSNSSAYVPSNEYNFGIHSSVYFKVYDFTENSGGYRLRCIDYLKYNVTKEDIINFALVFGLDLND